MNISLPFNFKYRTYQQKIVDFMRGGGKRWVLMYHRRAWKDKVMFNITVEMAMRKVWGYAYVLPSYAQAKKILWDSLDKDGKSFRDHIPKELLISTNEQELKINLANGSFVQLLWSDKIDSLRGISPAGIVFSEYAFQNPEAWTVMRPILKENGGWALFNSTPNGKNHFFDMFNMAMENENWFCQKLTIDDTKDAEGKAIVTQEDIAEERASGMDEAMIQQEYFCNFDVWAIGSYYGEQMEEARNDNRITQLPFNKDTPVDLYFDLGVNDSFTISFKQNQWQFYNFVNYYESSGKTLEHYFSVIDTYIEEKRGSLGLIYLPHDSKQKAQSYLVSWTTIFEKFEEHYPNKVKYIQKSIDINIDIQQARSIFPQCRFDADNCAQLIRCLDNYRKDWDDKKKVFRNAPDHNWASHWADNFRYFAVSDKKAIKKRSKIFTPSYVWI